MRPAPITALSVLSAAAALYLVSVASTMFLNWDAFSFRSGSLLLAGFETAGPLAFLLGAAIYGVIAFGLWTLRNWARHAAIGFAALQAVLALPRISEDTISFSFLHLALTGFPILVAAALVFYLAKPSTVAAFAPK